MGGDVLVLRFDPAILQHGIDVVVPKRVLAPVQQVGQVIKGQVSPLAEAENCCLNYLPRRFPHRSNRSCNLAQCIQMFGACDQMFEALCQMFEAPPANVRSSASNRSQDLRTSTFHRVAARTVGERAPARPLAHQKPFLDRAARSHGDVVRMLFRRVFDLLWLMHPRKKVTTRSYVRRSRSPKVLTTRLLRDLSRAQPGLAR